MRSEYSPINCRMCGILIQAEADRYGNWPYCRGCGAKRKKQAHPGQTYPFPCKVCGRQINTSRERYQEALRCRACGRKYATENMRRVTARARGETIPKKPFGRKPTPYPFACKKCGELVRGPEDRGEASLMCRQCRSDYAREKWLLARYGLTLKEKYKLNGGYCAICGIKSKHMHVDHDHKSNQVRGLLCGHCNSMIGYGLEDPSRLRKGAEYLEHWLHDPECSSP